MIKFFNLTTTNVVWYIALALAVLIIFIVLSKKYPIAGKTLSLIVVFTLTGGAIFSGVNIHNWYSAKGETKGNISSFLGGNQASVNNLEFTIKNIELKSTINENEYKATMTIYENLELDKNMNYSMFLNNTPCYNFEFNQDHGTAKYKYNFYNKANELVMNDELIITITIFKNYSILEISTRSGSEAVKYWNSYFNKNNCVFTIKPTDNTTNSDINYSDGVTNVVIVKYFVNDNFYLTQVYKKGDKVVMPTYDDPLFKGWSLLNNGLPISCFTITEDTNFYAIFGTSDSNSDTDTSQPDNPTIGDAGETDDER